MNALFHCLLLNLLTSRNYPHFNIVCFLFSFYKRCNHAQIFNATISATADKNIIHFLSFDIDARLQTHVLKRFLKRWFFFFINLALQPLVEPDFGWHLRTGLDLLSHGWRMPLTDPYSHTVPEWPWVEHAWVTDGIVALIYSGLGSAGGLGVILLFAAVITGAFVLSAATARASRTARALSVAVVAWIALPFLGARIQMVTLLGLASVLWLWNRFQQGRVRTLWLFPPLFLLWANVHGGFTAGLFTLGLLLAVTIFMRIVADRRPAWSERVDEPILTSPQIRHMAVIFGISVALVELFQSWTLSMIRSLLLGRTRVPSG